mmetsp:Transcript_60053/g.143024  ORF Transcript_60053/g.143024 Transcript_60053/m.143024 type:complete len:220 (+) Transcript_60053:99-758(+)
MWHNVCLLVQNTLHRGDKNSVGTVSSIQLPFAAPISHDHVTLLPAAGRRLLLHELDLDVQEIGPASALLSVGSQPNDITVKRWGVAPSEVDEAGVRSGEHRRQLRLLALLHHPYPPVRPVRKQRCQLGLLAHEVRPVVWQRRLDSASDEQGQALGAVRVVVCLIELREEGPITCGASPPFRQKGCSGSQLLNAQQPHALEIHKGLLPSLPASAGEKGHE